MSFVVYLLFFFVLIMIGGIIGILRYQRARKKVIPGHAVFLKAKGKKISVAFNSCALVHREYDEGAGKIKKHISIITYQADEIGGKKILFKTLPIFLPEDKLRQRITRFKTTAIYYDPANPDNYYFDVEFLVKFMLS